MDGRVTAVAAGDGRRPKKSRELRGLETSLNYSSDVQIHRVNAGRHGAVVPSLMSARNVAMTTSQVSMPRTYTIPQPTGPLYTDKNGKRLPMPGTREPSTDTDDDDNECDPGRSWTLCTDDGRLLAVKKEMLMEHEHDEEDMRRGQRNMEATAQASAELAVHAASVTGAVTTTSRVARPRAVNGASAAVGAVQAVAAIAETDKEINNVTFATSRSMLDRQPGATLVTHSGSATAKAKATDVSADSEAARRRRMDRVVAAIEAYVEEQPRFAQYSGRRRRRSWYSRSTH